MLKLLDWMFLLMAMIAGLLSGGIIGLVVAGVVYEFVTGVVSSVFLCLFTSRSCGGQV